MQIVRQYGLVQMSDLTTPSSTQSSVYRLGDVVEVYDDAKKCTQQYTYVYAPGALTAYVPYNVTNTGTAGQEVKAIAPAQLSAPVALIGVPQVAFTSGYYGWVLTKGKGTGVLTASTGYVTACSCTVLPAGAAFVGSTGLIQTTSTAAYLVTNT